MTLGEADTAANAAFDLLTRAMRDCSPDEAAKLLRVRAALQMAWACDTILELVPPEMPEV